MDEEDFNNEWNYIKNVTALNGFSFDFVNKIFHKFKNKKEFSLFTTLKPERESRRRICLPFYPKVTNKLSSIFKEFDMEIVTSSNNTLKSQLCNYKDRTNPLHLSGIYSISCADCDMIYIGQTRRRVENRLNEHISATRNGLSEKSGVACHMLEENHNIDLQNMKLIKPVIKPIKLNAWESMLICNCEAPLMNIDDAPINSPLFYLYNTKI